MLLTKSLYKNLDKNDGMRILVTRYYPRGVKRENFNEWIRELAPSKELLLSFKNGKIDEEEYEKIFRKEMKNEKSQNILYDIAAKSTKQNITLLCYEPEDMFCHRHILADMIKHVLKT